MTTSEKLNEFFCEYKADFEAALRAEREGNIPGATELYKRAALALCRMAELETGETRKQRIMHAREVKEHAEKLTAPVPVANEGAPADKGGSAPANKPAAEDDPDNPWKSEGIPDTTFDDIVGMEDVKRLIRERVLNQIKNPELYEAYGLKGGTGVLLFGLPGTGKTTIARAIAHEMNAPLFLVNLSDVLSKWVGESEKLIKQLFDKARQSESALIFFDDFDEMGHQRTNDGNHNNKVIVELINQMDGFKRNSNTIVLLAATNKPWMIDSALMRPGRFEHHIYVPLPNPEARKVLIEKTMGSVPVDASLDFDVVSGSMQGYNGADVVSVVKSAKSSALQRAMASNSRMEPVTYEDFAAAIQSHPGSVNPLDIVDMRKYAAAYDITLPEEM